jgi:hypothetical protein
MPLGPRVAWPEADPAGWRGWHLRSMPMCSPATVSHPPHTNHDVVALLPTLQVWLGGTRATVGTCMLPTVRGKHLWPYPLRTPAGCWRWERRLERATAARALPLLASTTGMVYVVCSSSGTSRERRHRKALNPANRRTSLLGPTPRARGTAYLQNPNIVVAGGGQYEPTWTSNNRC